MGTILDRYTKGQIYFIGCGGAGMAPLMYLTHKKGFNISGSDLEKSKNTENLSTLGINIHIGHNAENLPADLKNTLVVYSSAVKPENPEFMTAKNGGCPCLRRGEMLAEIAKLYKRTAAISGSHGKTSITSILAHILKETGFNPGYMTGGKVKGWTYSSEVGNGDIFVTEVDESDGTHALIHSHIGIVPNVEDDHCWSVGGTEALYNNFRKFALQSEKLIYISNEMTDKLFSEHKNKQAIDINTISSDSFFKYLSVDELNELKGFQRMNSALAVAAAVELGVDREKAEKATLSFPGVERRMTMHFKDENFILIEDYAHHPTEVSASINTLREKFPGKKLKIVFQPHRYARLQRYFDGFAHELGKADSLVILPVFAAWIEKSGNMVSSENLAEKIGSKAEYMDGSWQDIAKKISSEIEPGTVLALLAAGDADRLLPFIKEAFLKK